MLGTLVLTLAAAQQLDGITDYALVWETPAQDASDSEPMGNGEVAANVWIEESGELLLLFARHDTHSEASRLLKPGRLRVAFDPPPSGKFEQKLNLYAGRLEIRWGDLELEVFAEVDAPHFRISGRSETPRAVRASVESWRSFGRRLSGEELNSSWTMRGAPESVEVREGGDMLMILEDEAVLLHVGGESVVPFTLRHQGIESLADLCGDPLAHRMFGVMALGEGFVATETNDLLHAAASEFELTIAVPTPMQSESVTDGALWAEAAMQRARSAAPTAEVRTATATHWEDFWFRSWIFVRGDSQSFEMPTHEGELRLGVDSNGANLWQGEFSGAYLLMGASALDPEHLLARQRPEKLTSGVVVDDDGRRPTQICMKTWLRRDPSGKPARIFDWMTAGGSDGFLFDTHPGKDLRFIVGTRTLIAPDAWPDDGAWHHVAATYDETNGAMSIWRDGERVAATEAVAPQPPSRVTQSYVLQRWVTACQGRGSFPIKFNGGLFTVEPAHAGGPGFDADWRRWGDAFWWQNTRLPYYAMLAAGDADLMPPLFDFYERVLPLCLARTKLYYGAEGVYFPETITPFGSYANGDYGWERAGLEPSVIQCPWWQWEWNQGLELVDLMLLHHVYVGDYPFARDHLLPMAREVLKYFDSRFARDDRGVLSITPTQALETHWYGVFNDMPCVAGLHSVLPRLRSLPETWTTPEDRALFDRLIAALPPLPVREVDGVRLFSPAQEYDPSRQNVETPELYALFPFRLAALGGNEDKLQLAREAYARRHDRQSNGWTQDGIFAARLGLAEEARENLQAKVRNTHPAFRFPAMWGPNFDWLPDQCHGGNLMLLIQEMLLQTDGDRILLFPAWPKDWNVDFKLHAPYDTIVECSLHEGRLEHLTVTPSSRLEDVVNLLD